MFKVSKVPAGLSRVRLIATDMDNTLLDGESRLPEGLYERVLELRRLGVAFAIASGRPIATLLDQFPRLGPEVVLIGDNGGAICDRGELVEWADLPVADYQHMIGLAREHGDVPMVCCKDETVFEERHRRYDAEYAVYYHRRRYVADITTLADPADKFTIFMPGGNAVARIEEVYAPALGERFNVVAGGARFIDIMNKGVDKGEAMRRLSELEGIDLDDMMAFGDTFNDAGMLAAVGFGYMMANATPGMERYARYVAPSNLEHGVLTVIDQVIAAKRGRS